MDAVSSSSSSSPSPLHVVICPWLAFGHLLPCLDLAEGAESTRDVPSDKVDLLWKAFDGLAAPFAEGSRRPADWVIADTFDPWRPWRCWHERGAGRHRALAGRAAGVYVALGSEVPLSVDQVHELALGLELAGTRFLWALRKPDGVTDDDILPPGFEERTQNQGLVTMGWVPQISILAHGAVGAFLTHCGWNSTIEGFLFGLPLIMLPIYGDQGGPNARLMEGKKVGMQVPRDENDGSFHREGVSRAVRAVMLEEETRSVFLANAKRLQQIVGDHQLHERYIDGFVDQLRSYKK
ncbi:hypothetical protein PR202_gb10670 [Eleusine coracana subsp. coracana]|uniref:UDP-glycosyltransferases domain-containing protein n=1 Tax=Eleusine coracana subsp. coracana TaxID=191504 RepID=A0AAV5EI75_ELECO|nr:hypothetical protein PR202_gb10670 [Eleusine coracana subsp. coracana]